MSSNAEFIAAHRARRAERDAAAMSFSPAPARVAASVVPALRLWPLHALAAICGLTREGMVGEMPKHWRRGFHWFEVGGRIEVAEYALPEFVGTLATDGNPEPAKRLMKWLLERKELTAGSGAAGSYPRGLDSTQTPAAPAQEHRPWYRGEAGGMA